MSRLLAPWFDEPKRWRGLDSALTTVPALFGALFGAWDPRVNSSPRPAEELEGFPNLTLRRCVATASVSEQASEQRLQRSATAR
ncbi:hypothetical protein CCM_03766 [Cordyceps militaris CM01]|uniref:Uncharacterized protein n=2 Tax=Cordyceps militaris TaxID=73501 RepID=G3JGH6_CORMM|nr:uncharacterized protein CCM_03766 [Cordyceps militaris CM01]ATY66690.1 hypothetical protein A9K55_001032 [Cordyceps militaris]EGX92393.1 hypothetical protein CCM_03766 [Cordyceps militaris CM01]